MVIGLLFLSSIPTVTGTAFGGVYLATGRLAAAVAALGAYNLVVLARDREGAR